MQPFFVARPNRAFFRGGIAGRGSAPNFDLFGGRYQGEKQRLEVSPEACSGPRRAESSCRAVWLFKEGL